MANSPLRTLEAFGVSVWNDNIRRSWVTSGDLKKLIDEDGLSGVTSNPTIFEKAIGGSSDYDQDLRRLVQEGKGAEDIFKALASTDIGMAADVLRPVYDRTNGLDGYVSIEVSPQAAHDTQKTLDDAHYFWSTIDRPNIMIKVPATPEGIPAIEQLISEGINVNITLIFAVEVYEDVMEAYLRGLERRAEAGGSLDRVASVASFFVSRVDTLVDNLLDQKEQSADDAQRQEIDDLKGKAAIANAQIAYEHFERVFFSDRFKALQAKGAQMQKPLWASTSTKNPKYPDTMYVDNLVGEHTVNTMPPQLIVAERDHGKPRRDSVKAGLPLAHAVIDRLAAVGIQMREVTDQLTREGVESFTKSLDGLFGTIEQKSAAIIAEQVGRDSASLDGQQATVDETFKQMGENDFLKRLWNKDPALWKPNPADQSEITDRLGWLHVSDSMLENVGKLTDLAAAVKEAGYSHAVVLGMGGSSLAPYVLARSFGRQAGFPELLVLDSTDPEAVQAVQQEIDPTKTLFMVSSKSGTTLETLSHFKTFWQIVSKSVGQEKAGQQFIAITDPGTPLEGLAREHNFRMTFCNQSDIGGRYSAMSYFGMVPAAVAGIDVTKLLDRAHRMEQACAPSVPPEENPGAWLGSIMGNLAKEGRDKVTFFVSPTIDALGLWLEQLLAESTGKEGKGLVPVPDNPPGAPSSYGEDRLFVTIELEAADSGDINARVEALHGAGHPVVRLQMEDLYDLAAEFFRWEFATAVAGALLGINAFDQPNVQESKDNTKRVLETYSSSGALPEPEPLVTSDGIAVYANESARALLGNPSDAASALGAFFSRLQPPEYLAIMAYVAPSPEHDRALEPLRATLRDARRVATTLGYGPRFLHSTGQLHKGGPPEGAFLQITADASTDVPIPDAGYTFETLIKAQALGDFQSLQQHGRPAVRIHLADESDASFQRLTALVDRALQTQPTSVA